VAVCCLVGGGPMGIGVFDGVARADPSNGGPSSSGGLNYGSLNPCEQAGIAAEQANGLPAGLLLAIGRVESGRWDAARGRMTAWPWTINAAGKGQFFESPDAAAHTVRVLLEGGVRSIDIGCFQISLLWHPLAFSSLEKGFDPEANARYAARFLLTLFGRTGSWEAAVEAYHSADPALGFAYRQQVFSTWSGAPSIAALASMPMRTATMVAITRAAPVAPSLPLVIAGVRIWTPMPVGEGARVVAMPPVAMPPPGGQPHPERANGEQPNGEPAGLSVSAASVSPPLPTVTYRVMPRR
jgi:hypothetical protein